MGDQNLSGADDKSRNRHSVRAMSALYKLLGWITLGVGLGFAVTLFSFSASSDLHTDMIISLASGLICILVTIAVFTLTYALSEILKMMVDIGESTSNLSKDIKSVLDRIDIETEEQSTGPKVEEVEPSTTDANN